MQGSRSASPADAVYLPVERLVLVLHLFERLHEFRFPRRLRFPFRGKFRFLSPIAGLPFRLGLDEAALLDCRGRRGAEQDSKCSGGCKYLQTHGAASGLPAAVI
jgi:hypothetical protein